MSRAGTEVTVVSLSVRLYELLLVVYPRPFRNEYGRHMLQVFRDCSLRVNKEEGFVGLISLWALTLLDWLRSVVEQHLEKETLVTRNTLIRLSGWAMVVGGAASSLGVIFLILSEEYLLRVSAMWEAVLVVAFFYGPLGVGLGLLGLRARYGEDIGEVGKLAMLVGAIGGIALVLIGDVVQSLPNNLDDNGFWIFTVGLFLTFAILELYGLVALIRRPQERWNGLAAVAGLPISIMALITASSSNGAEAGSLIFSLAIIFISLLIIMGIALAMLGYQLQAEAPEHVSAEAGSA